MTDEEVDDLAEFLYSECDKEIRDGWRISPYVAVDTCCPFGAALQYKHVAGWLGRHPSAGCVSHALPGLDYEGVRSFMMGFDDYEAAWINDPRLYTLGEQMREHYAGVRS